MIRIQNGIYVVGLLSAAVLCDQYIQKVPNDLIIVSCITSFYLSWEKVAAWGCFHFLFHLVWPIVLLYPVYLLGGLGAGDIKVFGVMSSFLQSMESTIWIIGCAICIGAIFGLLRYWKVREKGYKLHFTICILLAFVGCVCKEEMIWKILIL